MAAVASQSISLEEIETILKTATERRAMCNYSHCSTLHFRFANDNTYAEKDEESFKNICELLRFPAPQCHVIEENNPTPGFTMRSVIENEIQNALKRDGRTALIIHYAGHGTENGNGNLLLGDSKGKKFTRVDLLLGPFGVTELATNAPIDVLFIFDCCFGFLSTRNFNHLSRIVEVVAGNDERDPEALSAKGALSLTAKLHIELRMRAQQGDKSVEISDLISFLRRTSPIKKPTHSVKLGLGSIVLPLDASSPAAHSSLTAHPPTRPPATLSYFTLHASPTCSSHQVHDIADWVASFPHARNVSLRFEGAKRVQSTLFFLEVSTPAFGRIMGLPGVMLICEHMPFMLATATSGPSSSNSGSAHCLSLRRPHSRGSISFSKGTNDENQKPGQDRPNEK